MSNRHLKSSILVVLMLLSIGMVGCSTQNNDTIADSISGNTINELEPKVDNTEDKIDWIESKLRENVENSVDIPYNNIQVKIKDNKFEFPFEGSKLTELGIVDTADYDIPGHNETYGDIRTDGTNELLVGYLNLQSTDLNKEYCLVSNLQVADNSVGLQIAEQEINITDSIFDILKIFKDAEFEIMYSNNEESEYFKDLTIPYVENNSSRVSVLNADEKLGTFSLSIATKKDIEVIAYNDGYLPEELVNKTFNSVGYINYILSGTFENGLDLIIINYSAVDANELAYRYDYLQ